MRPFAGACRLVFYRALALEETALWPVRFSSTGDAELGEQMKTRPDRRPRCKRFTRR